MSKVPSHGRTPIILLVPHAHVLLSMLSTNAWEKVRYFTPCKCLGIWSWPHRRCPSLRPVPVLQNAPSPSSPRSECNTLEDEVGCDGWWGQGGPGRFYEFTKLSAGRADARALATPAVTGTHAMEELGIIAYSVDVASGYHQIQGADLWQLWSSDTGRAFLPHLPIAHHIWTNPRRTSRVLAASLPLAAPLKNDDHVSILIRPPLPIGRVLDPPLSPRQQSSFGG
ncbi:hypothetical protein BDK51DRAFT_49067 [Blyttiomyces helicus]|uniref:Uncharacterized protein n=1 Tax=Blyttiomyces helicus TaxID=388810 RepID=A0A4P9W8S8_9FUNG|nr:hypothetical protein BDK51DRAFT_49067 [Blyttiomyces helicus]|eukprot:RKO88774.1 hypothetical protein BDK51DRAFT_49067 [Blyttiomyces helicus]